MKEAYRVIRNHAGVIDLSHWTRFVLRGEGAANVLNQLVGANILSLYEGKATNTLIVSETGGVLAIVWIVALKEGFMIIGEPEDRGPILSKLSLVAEEKNLVLEDRTENHFALTLAGPEALGFAECVLGDEVHSIAFLSGMEFPEYTLLAVRLGLFGEYELHLFGDMADKNKVLEKLFSQGVPRVDAVVAPTLMAEMRTLSRTRDIPADISVFECGLAWMVDFRKDDFHGKQALVSRREESRSKCVMVLVEGSHSQVVGASLQVGDANIGKVQSAYRSETLGKTVAIAYVDHELAWPGIEMTVNECRALTIGAPAFLTKSVLNSLGSG